jgi:hypothetical protein
MVDGSHVTRFAIGNSVMAVNFALMVYRHVVINPRNWSNFRFVIDINDESKYQSSPIQSNIVRLSKTIQF